MNFISKNACEYLISKTLLLLPTSIVTHKSIKINKGKIYSKVFNQETNRYKYVSVSKDEIYTNEQVFNDLLDYFKTVIKRDDYAAFLLDLKLLKEAIACEWLRLKATLKLLNEELNKIIPKSTVSFRNLPLINSREIKIVKFCSSIEIIIYIPSTETNKIEQALELVDEVIRTISTDIIPPSIFRDVLLKKHQKLFIEKDVFFSI